MTPIGKDSSGPEAHSWESSCTEPCPQDQGAVLAVDASTTHRRVPGAARAAECPPGPQGVQRQTNPPPGRPGSPGLAPDHPQQAPPRPREAPASAHSPDVENFPEARTLLAEGGSTHMLRPSPHQWKNRARSGGRGTRSHTFRINEWCPTRSGWRRALGGVNDPRDHHFKNGRGVDWHHTPAHDFLTLQRVLCSDFNFPTCCF